MLLSLVRLESLSYFLAGVILPRHERNSLQLRLSSLTLSLVRLESLSYFLAGVISTLSFKPGAMLIAASGTPNRLVP